MSCYKKSSFFLLSVIMLWLAWCGSDPIQQRISIADGVSRSIDESYQTYYVDAAKIGNDTESMQSYISRIDGEIENVLLISSYDSPYETSVLMREQFAANLPQSLLGYKLLAEKEIQPDCSDSEIAVHLYSFVSSAVSWDVYYLSQSYMVINQQWYMISYGADNHSDLKSFEKTLDQIGCTSS